MIMVAAARGPCQCMRVCRVSIHINLTAVVGWLSEARGRKFGTVASKTPAPFGSSETAETAAACARMA